jgi:hypothetical protein
VDESVARTIADGRVHARYGGRAEFLGVNKIDRDRLITFLEGEWRRGQVPLTESQFRAEVEEDLKVRPCRPRWVVSYLVYGAGPGELPTVASVTVDDETGEVDSEAEDQR